MASNIFNKIFVVFIILFISASLKSSESSLKNFNNKNHIYRKKPGFVTNGPWGGRLGDQLLILLKTLWIAKKYNLTYIYQYNKWLDGLEISSNGRNFSKNAHKLKKIPYQNENVFELSKPNYLFLTSFFFHPDDWAHHVPLTELQTITNNHKFINEFRRLVRPKKCINSTLVYPPISKTSIAVHVRIYEKEKAFFSRQIFNDPSSKFTFQSNKEQPLEYIDKLFPTKFPPLQYYIDQINFLTSYLKGNDFYIFLFTDHPHPEQLANLFLNNVESKKNIIIDWRKNIPDLDEVTFAYSDFFSLLNFDYLIRSAGSTFALIAHLAKNYKGVIYPTGYFWNDDFLKMTDIHMEIDNKIVLINESND